MPGEAVRRLCSKCRRQYPATSEYFRKVGETIRQPCRTCQREDQRQYRLKQGTRTRPAAWAASGTEDRGTGHWERETNAGWRRMVREFLQGHYGSREGMERGFSPSTDIDAREQKLMKSTLVKLCEFCENKTEV